MWNIWNNRKSNRALEMRQVESTFQRGINYLTNPEVSPPATFWMRFQREIGLKHLFFKEH
jgi:hypothetical protein